MLCKDSTSAFVIDPCVVLHSSATHIYAFMDNSQNFITYPLTNCAKDLHFRAYSESETCVALEVIKVFFSVCSRAKFR